MLEAAQVGPDDGEAGVPLEDPVAGGDELGVGGEPGAAVEMPLRVLRVVAVVDALRVEGAPGVERLRQVGEEGLAALGKAVQKQAAPMRTTLTQAHWRRQVAMVMAQRLVRELAEAR